MNYAPNLVAIMHVMERIGYKVFKNPSGHDLNIVGIRTADDTANTFNDWLAVFYLRATCWNFFCFPATTDPGVYYRKNPINVLGTAVLRPGQYPGAFKIGTHKGYKALQQKGPLTVYRDSNRDVIIDTVSVQEQTGIHAINIHRANADHATNLVDKWSAGCQVLQDPDHFDFLLVLCERGRKRFGNSFTYTLLHERDL